MTTTNKVYVLFHANCQDGLGSKYAAWCKYGDNGAEYIPVSYGQPIPVLEDGSEVYIIDFSYDKETLLTLKKRMADVVVLDHHKSAEEALKGLDFAFFDMNRSGAVMAWNYFHPEEEVPRALLRIQDRDLWRWQYKNTKPVTSAIQLLGDNMSVWDNSIPLMNLLEEEGKAIESYKDHSVERTCRDYNVTLRTWKGFNVAIINASELQSEIGAYLYEKYPVDFVIIYSLSATGLVSIGLRSKAGFGADVSEIAKLYGGGGHKNAAGCSAPTSIIHEWYAAPFYQPKE